MAIDINNREALRKLTLKDLIDDAVEKKNIEALRFLEDESSKKETKTKKDGSTYEGNRNLMSIRTDYLKKFCNYVPQSELSKEEQKAKQKAKREKEKSDMFADAFAQIKGKKNK